MVVRGEVTKEKLTNIYDLINQIIKNEECYYSDDEVNIIKNDEENVLLKI